MPLRVKANRDVGQADLIRQTLAALATLTALEKQGNQASNEWGETLSTLKDANALLWQESKATVRGRSEDPGDLEHFLSYLK